MALARPGIDDEDRLVGVIGAPDVRDRNSAGVLEGRGRVQARHLGDDLLARAEAVVAVPLLGPDRVVGDVARHVEQLEVQPPAGVGGRVGDSEVVVRPGLKADRRRRVGHRRRVMPRAPAPKARARARKSSPRKEPISRRRADTPSLMNEPPASRSASYLSTARLSFSDGCSASNGGCGPVDRDHEPAPGRRFPQGLPGDLPR